MHSSYPSLFESWDPWWEGGDYLLEGSCWEIHYCSGGRDTGYQPQFHYYQLVDLGQDI